MAKKAAKLVPCLRCGSHENYVEDVRFYRSSPFKMWWKLYMSDEILH